MRMIDTESIMEEYAETYNRYMLLPLESKEFEPLEKRLKELESTLSRRFLWENGYTSQRAGEFSIFVKENADT